MGVDGGASLWIAAALTAASTGVAVYSTRQQGRYAQRMGEERYKQAQIDALRAQQMGAAEAAKVRDATARRIASQRAALGASGVDLSSGSPLELLADTAMLGELDEQTVKWNTASRVQSLLTEGMYAREMGRNENIGARWQAGASLLSGASDIAGMGWSKKAKKPKADYSAGTGEVRVVS